MSLQRTRHRKRNRFALPYHIRFNTDGGSAGGGGENTPPATPPAGGEAPPPATTPPADTTPPASPPAGGDTPPATPPAADDWRKDWPDELKNDPALKDFKTMADLAKSLVETKKLVGAKPIKVPGADATDEERKAFDSQYREAMVPKDPKEYGLAKPENMAPELEPLFSEEGLGEFATTAMELGLRKDQVAGLQAFDMKRVQALMDSANQQAQQREDAFMADFTKRHGANATKVLDNAMALIDGTGNKDDAQIIASAPEAVRKAVANVLHGVSQKYIGEDRLPNRTDGGTVTRTVSELETDLRTLIAKPEYRDAFHANHRATLEESTRLSQQIAAQKAAGKK
ncbi:hypothetical protein UFOVP315_48 [uncultured Caudovirales phage]|uniref:Uncharacterized protein n=1 Tax=uncultured Caudovirales phage TaxID=2100421 RepID=A0A6J5LR79_9CAUD|nr:hypothetical protein UFOVP315_48 [uncultured Caudovirales phage]